MATSFSTKRFLGLCASILYRNVPAGGKLPSSSVTVPNWSEIHYRNRTLSVTVRALSTKQAMEEQKPKVETLEALKELPFSAVDLDAPMTVVKDESSDVKKESDIKEDSTVTVEDKTQSKREFLLLRKRKMVLMLSYCGQGYLGMQKNPGMKTIEDDLFQALLKAGYIDDEALKAPRLMQFQRAARTDKHVSAARQIVSLKLPDSIDVEKINSFLAPEIRVMGAKKVTKGFDSKQSCDARTYMYMIPTFAFVPVNENVTEDYRITPEVLESVRETLKMYLGTKNFHNFTSRRKPTDPSSKRYIISFTASDPFVKDGLEYIILRVKGQSFMLHQIRKMIGLVVAYLRGFAGKDTLEKVWALERIDIPKAPGVGLVLDHVHYERYNKRYGSDGIHLPLTWDEEESKVEEFCQNFIYPVITKTENGEKSMFEWLTTLVYHTYDVRQQIRNLPIQNDEDGMPVNPSPKEFSQIGRAAFLANKGELKLDEDEDENGDDDDSIDAVEAPKKATKTKVNDNDEDHDSDDEEIVKSVLAKRRKVND